jgi:hypothetical protein
MHGFIQTTGCLYSVTVTETTHLGVTVYTCTCEAEDRESYTGTGMCARSVLNRVRIHLRGIFSSI